MDNNLGATRRMKLNVCDWRNTVCDTDQGNFASTQAPSTPLSRSVRT
jgi:hypothetical protein